MNMKYVWIIGLLLLASCKKRDDNGPVTGTMPNTCSYTATTVYQGAILPFPGYASPHQDVTVAADETTRPDKLHIYLCRNVDCTANPLPAATCASYGLTNLTAPCYTTSPSVYIASGPHTVRFINANKEGYSDIAHQNAQTPDIPAYSSYYITEQLCQ